MTTKLQPYQGSYLTPSLEKAIVRDAMRTGVMSCEPDLPAATVARMMATHHIHAVVVEGIHHDPIHGERLSWGVVSDMDLVAHLHELDAIRAEGAASTPAVAIEVTAPVTEAAALMAERAVSHLVVIADERPVGVVSTLDIAGAVAWGG